mmetsp:Transcript_47239/g.69982  ORF Transcript_47239/g.69982 Transcript_47239/m.69982 type:complete len:227 (+) Transcript_47239:171-851(+)
MVTSLVSDPSSPAPSLSSVSPSFASNCCLRVMALTSTLSSFVLSMFATLTWVSFFSSSNFFFSSLLLMSTSSTEMSSTFLLSVSFFPSLMFIVTSFVSTSLFTALFTAFISIVSVSFFSSSEWSLPSLFLFSSSLSSPSFFSSLPSSFLSSQSLSSPSLFSSLPLLSSLSSAVVTNLAAICCKLISKSGLLHKTATANAHARFCATLGLLSATAIICTPAHTICPT